MTRKVFCIIFFPCFSSPPQASTHGHMHYGTQMVALMNICATPTYEILCMVGHLLVSWGSLLLNTCIFKPTHDDFCIPSMPMGATNVDMCLVWLTCCDVSGWAQPKEMYVRQVLKCCGTHSRNTPVPAQQTGKVKLPFLQMTASMVLSLPRICLPKFPLS